MLLAEIQVYCVRGGLCDSRWTEAGLEPLLQGFRSLLWVRGGEERLPSWADPEGIYHS